MACFIAQVIILFLLARPKATNLGFGLRFFYSKKHRLFFTILTM